EGKSFPSLTRRSAVWEPRLALTCTGMKISRRTVLKSLTAGYSFLPVRFSPSECRPQADKAASSISGTSLDYGFVDTARGSGLNFRHYCGGEQSKKYI